MVAGANMKINIHYKGLFSQKYLDVDKNMTTYGFLRACIDSLFGKELKSFNKNIDEFLIYDIKNNIYSINDIKITEINIHDILEKIIGDSSGIHVMCKMSIDKTENINMRNLLEYLSESSMTNLNIISELSYNVRSIDDDMAVLNRNIIQQTQYINIQKLLNKDITNINIVLYDRQFFNQDTIPEQIYLLTNIIETPIDDFTIANGNKIKKFIKPRETLFEPNPKFIKQVIAAEYCHELNKVLNFCINIQITWYIITYLIDSENETVIDIVKSLRRNPINIFSFTGDVLP